jgi:hypothetical protein
MVLPTDTKSGCQISVPAKKPITDSVTETASHNALVTPNEPAAPAASPAPTGVEYVG